MAAYINAYEEALPPGAWPNWVLGNHDRSRVATRVGPEQARIAVTRGKEIGMTEATIPVSAVQDPWE